MRSPAWGAPCVVLAAPLYSMDPHGALPMRSRRYGQIIEPAPQLLRNAVDDLGSSIAAPPPDAFAAHVSQSKAQTLLAAMDNHRAMEDDAAWTDSEPESGPAVRDLLEESMAPPRSFLSEMQGREERPWLEELQEEFPNIRRVPVPTVDDEEDEEAPRTVPSAPHVRTVLQAMSAGSEPPVDEPLTEIPVTEATAAAMERLAHDDEPAPEPTVRRKKTRSKAEYEVGPDGELVRKKKKKKETVRKKKKRHDAEPSDLRHEPLADLPQGMPSIDEPAESEFGAPMPFLDAVRRPATEPVAPRAPTPPAPTLPAAPSPTRSPTRSLAMTEAPVQPTPEQSRARVLNYNATRIVVNMYVVYWGMLVMLRRLWRWENPWLTGVTAAFYVVVWWRGDLLAVGFLFALLYVATFRLWLIPPAADEPQHASSSVSLRHGESLGLVTMTPSREMLQQVSDQVLVVTHGLADAQERMKNLLLWRSPMVTLRYLGWLMLLGLLSMQVTSWMLVRLPGALLFLLVFVLAPLIEYGHRHRLVELLCDVTGTEHPRPGAPYATMRTMLDNVLAGVPTDEEFLHEKLLRTHWEAERELRRRGQWIEPLNRIVEEMDVHRANLTGHTPEAVRTMHVEESYTSPRRPEAHGVWTEPMPRRSSVRASSVPWPLSPSVPTAPVPEAVEDDRQSVSDYGQAEPLWEAPAEPAPRSPEPASMASPGQRTSVMSPSMAAAAPVSVPTRPLSPVHSPSPAPPITKLFPLQPAELSSTSPITPPAPDASTAMEAPPSTDASKTILEAPSTTLDASQSPPSIMAPMSPPVAVPGESAEPRTPALHTPQPDEGVFLAVYRKRLGHLLVLPTRVAFLLSYSPRQPESVPGLTSSQVVSHSRTVDGRVFYPTIAPRSIPALVRDEMQGHGRTLLHPRRSSTCRSPT
ncbi:hypothetical protein MCAP1_000169 [Malassezia caprae]|uniref:Uncharacterized protein n=1 Tax=Malassezia caprae TaxID=1381934 RepID=A0AAF0E5T6_9BASI|nr:hypothetical protein MCAP1_000169 [Malassezia caprae]